MAAAPTALSHRRAAPAALSRRPIPVAIPWVSAAETTSAGAAIAQTNSGSNTGGIVAVTTGIGSTITQTNSGGNDLIDASTTGANSNIVVNNSGSTSTVLLTTTGPGSTETLINSGIVSSLVPGGAAIELFGGPATLTNIVGGRVIGSILLGGSSNTVNFAGGNWLFTIVAGSAPTSNANGAPFVVGPFNPATGNTQVAVLDATTFALADRALMNFTGEVQQTLQGRFDGMNFGAGGGGGAALGFAGQPSSTPGVADQAAQAFSGIPAVAMSYASDARATLGKAPAAPYTTVWASGFGGARKQNADGAVLPATDIAFGRVLGVDRAFGPNLRLGAFAGGGASRKEVELSVQTIDATYGFGGVYGRFDWVTQYLDFSLYGGGTNNNSTRGVANNTVATVSRPRPRTTAAGSSARN